MRVSTLILVVTTTSGIVVNGSFSANLADTFVVDEDDSSIEANDPFSDVVDTFAGVRYFGDKNEGLMEDSFDRKAEKGVPLDAEDQFRQYTLTKNYNELQSYRGKHRLSEDELRKLKRPHPTKTFKPNENTLHSSNGSSADAFFAGSFQPPFGPSPPDSVPGEGQSKNAKNHPAVKALIAKKRTDGGASSTGHFAEDISEGFGRREGRSSGGLRGREGRSGDGVRGREGPYGDGHDYSHGTSWNNHYQAPTKSSSYHSQYTEPERGDHNRYGDGGHTEYNYKDGDSDSHSYHSETPTYSTRYSGGSSGESHEPEEDYYGGGRNHYGGEDNDPGEGGSYYTGDNEGSNYGNYGEESHGYDSGNRGSYGESNYGGDKNGYDNDDGYGYDADGRNHFSSGNEHYGDDSGYHGDGRGHNAHTGGYDESSDEGYSPGHSDDPADEYAVYSPKYSRRFGDRSYRVDVPDAEGPGRGDSISFGSPLERIDFAPEKVRNNGNGDRRGREPTPSDHSKEDVEEDRSSGFMGDDRHEQFLDEMRQKTLEGFGELTQHGDATQKETDDSNEVEVNFGSQNGNDAGDDIQYDEFDDLHKLFQHGFPGTFQTIPQNGDAGYSSFKHGDIGPHIQEPNSFIKNFQQHTDDDAPSHIKEDIPHNDYQPATDHNGHKRFSFGKSYPSRYAEGVALPRQAADADMVMSGTHVKHPKKHSGIESRSSNSGDELSTNMKQPNANQMRKKRELPSAKLSTSSATNSAKEDHDNKAQSVKPSNQKGKQLNATSEQDKAIFKGPRGVHPVIHRYYEGVPHMVHRHMGDNVHTTKGNEDQPLKLDTSEKPTGGANFPGHLSPEVLHRKQTIRQKLLGSTNQRTRLAPPVYVAPPRKRVPFRPSFLSGGFRPGSGPRGGRALRLRGLYAVPDPPAKETPSTEERPHREETTSTNRVQKNQRLPVETFNSKLGETSSTTTFASPSNPYSLPQERLPLEPQHPALKHLNSLREVRLKENPTEDAFASDLINLDVFIPGLFGKDETEDKDELATRADTQRSSAFQPGKMQYGFTPIIPEKSKRSRRSLTEADDSLMLDLKSKALIMTSKLGQTIKQMRHEPAFSQMHPISSSYRESTQSNKNNTSQSTNNTTSSTIHHKKPFNRGKIFTVARPVIRDLTPAGMTFYETYQPSSDPEEYEAPPGYRSYDRNDDPYLRYLPLQGDGDPYFQYAPAGEIQHSHDVSLPREDFYDEETSLRGIGPYPTDSSRGRRRSRGDRASDRLGDNSEDHDDEFEDYSRDDYGDYWGGRRRGPRRGRRPYQRADPADYDEEEEYGGVQNERYNNPAYQSGRYQRKAAGDYYGDEGDERIRDLDDEIRAEASRGYDGSRRAVSSMLDSMRERKRDRNCRQIRKGDMTCLQCVNSSGMQTEDCAYASDDPNSHHVSYSESSRYGDQKRRKGGRRGRLRRGRRPGGARQRGTSDIYTDDRYAVYRDQEEGSVGDEDEEHRRDNGMEEFHFDNEIPIIELDESATAFDEGGNKIRPSLLNIPGAFKEGRFRDSYPKRAHSRRKRHLASKKRSSASIDAHQRWPSPLHGQKRRGSEVPPSPLEKDGSYTDRAKARFLESDDGYSSADDVDDDDDRKHSNNARSYRQYSRQQPRSLYKESGVAPEYHRRVTSSVSSGGGHDEYLHRPDRKRRPAADDVDYDYSEYGYDDSYQPSDSGAFIGNIYNYRSGKQPIDGKFDARLEEEDKNGDYPEEYSDYEYGEDYGDDGEKKPDYVDEYDEGPVNLQRANARDGYIRYSEDAQLPQKSDPDSRRRRQNDLEENQRSFGRIEKDNAHSAEYYSNAAKYPEPAARRPPTGDYVKGFRPFDERERRTQGREGVSRGDEGKGSSDKGYGLSSDRSDDAGRAENRRSDTYTNNSRLQRHLSSNPETRGAEATQTESAEDGGDTNHDNGDDGDTPPAAYEQHRYDRPDITRSYEVAAMRRHSAPPPTALSRVALHSDAELALSRVPGLSLSPAVDGGRLGGPETRFENQQTFESLSRGADMTRRYRDPGPEFFRQHPPGFEHFPTFDYIEAEKANK